MNKRIKKKILKRFGCKSYKVYNKIILKHKFKIRKKSIERLFERTIRNSYYGATLNSNSKIIEVSLCKKYNDLAKDKPRK